VWDLLPLVPKIVTWYVPAGPLHDNVELVLVFTLTVLELNVHASPDGLEEVARLTVRLSGALRIRVVTAVVFTKVVRLSLLRDMVKSGFVAGILVRVAFISREPFSKLGYDTRYECSSRRPVLSSHTYGMT
jgi:hypothetical protein